MSYTWNEQFGDLDVEVQMDHPEEGVSIRFDNPPEPDCVSYKDFTAAEYKLLLIHLLRPIGENGRSGPRYRKLSDLAYELSMLLAEPTEGGF